MYPGRTGVKRRFVEGVEEFIFCAKYIDHEEFGRQGGIRCPCLKCSFGAIKNEHEVRLHLYNNGFRPNYWTWSRHGEGAPGVAAVPAVNVPVEVVDHTSSSYPVTTTSEGWGIQPLDVYQGMISDAVGVNLDFEEPDADEVPNEEAQRFYMYLSETNKPLFEG